jgi:hypothetical protein
MNNRINDLETIKQVFDKFGVKFCLVYGALLGLHRDGKLIEHDDDIDLAVIENLDLKTRKDIGWALYDLGFQPQNIAFNVFGRMEPSELGYNGSDRSGIIVCERNFKFTIFFTPEFCRQHNEAELVCIPKLGAVTLIATPQKFFDKLGKIKLNKKEYSTPYPIEKYLEHSYINWKDKTMRDHSPTFFEYHARGQEHLDITGKNEVQIMK